METVEELTTSLSNAHQNQPLFFLCFSVGRRKGGSNGEKKEGKKERRKEKEGMVGLRDERKKELSGKKG